MLFSNSINVWISVAGDDVEIEARSGAYVRTSACFASPRGGSTGHHLLCELTYTHATFHTQHTTCLLNHGLS